MLRGNHECRQLTSFFNFKNECEVKYDDEVYDRIMESFDSLPLACIINEKFVAVHGGISPSVESVYFDFMPSSMKLIKSHVLPNPQRKVHSAIYYGQILVKMMKKQLRWDGMKIVPGDVHTFLGIF